MTPPLCPHVNLLTHILTLARAHILLWPLWPLKLCASFCLLPGPCYFGCQGNTMLVHSFVYTLPQGSENLSQCCAMVLVPLPLVFLTTFFSWVCVLQGAFGSLSSAQQPYLLFQFYFLTSSIQKIHVSHNLHYFIILGNKLKNVAVVRLWRAKNGTTIIIYAMDIGEILAQCSVGKWHILTLNQ